MKLKGATLLCNYPDCEVEAAIPDKLTLSELVQYLQRLGREEDECTSFVLTAVIDREGKT